MPYFGYREVILDDGKIMTNVGIYKNENAKMLGSKRAFMVNIISLKYLGTYIII